LAPGWGLIGSPSGPETEGEPINVSETAGTRTSRGDLPDDSTRCSRKSNSDSRGIHDPGSDCPSVLLTRYPAATHFQLHTLSEGTMDSSKDKGRNELTPEQKGKVRPATEKDAKAVELSVEELEERIAPRAMY
jgi:hypothetical protein